MLSGISPPSMVVATRREQMRQQLTGPNRDRMIAEGQEQQARYFALKEERMARIKMAALIVKDPELIQELRRVRSMGKPLSTWEREVLSKAEEEQR